MSAATLLFLNGFAGCGKSTIAKRYIDEHPLALVVEGDDIITNLGQWQQYKAEATACKLALSESMVVTHLQAGYDVVLPFLLIDENHAQRYADIAEDADARFVEVLLAVPKEEAVERLRKRGSWGEKGLPPLTEDDHPKIEKLYDSMILATNKRPNTVAIYPEHDQIEDTYNKILKLTQSILPTS